ncbi:MAG: peptide deformylase [Pseudomonadales bacterium]|nr:peptide deformylase [Pseudomonadales bacterium]
MEAEHQYEIIEIGNPLLAAMAQPVKDFECASLADHIQAMFDLMEARGGVGIAAPQVGVSLQLMIIASKPNQRYPNAPFMEPLLMINPAIEWQSEEQILDWEGCLSVPGIRGRVNRSEAIAISYHCREGIQHKSHLEGFPARVFLHEYDHLVGKTFLDRVESASCLYSEKEYLRCISQVK